MLGSAGGGGADGAPPDDPVTSLDMFVGSDYLVAGHGSGRVLLWDYLRYWRVFCEESEALDAHRCHHITGKIVCHVRRRLYSVERHGRKLVTPTPDMTFFSRRPPPPPHTSPQAPLPPPSLSPSFPRLSLGLPQPAPRFPPSSLGCVLVFSIMPSSFNLQQGGCS